MTPDETLKELRNKLFEMFGKLTRFENEVIDEYGALEDATAEQQIEIAERVLAERSRGWAGYVHECGRVQRRKYIEK